MRFFSIAALVSFVTHTKANDEVVVASNIQIDQNVKETKAEQHRHRRLQLLLSQRWKDRIGDVVIVPYRFAKDATFDENQKDLIDRSLKYLGDESKVVQFVRRNKQPAHIVVRNDGTGCFSNHVGRTDSGTSQTVNLDIGLGCVNNGTIQHEFLHALGMFHEHTRTDRDQFVKINLQNVEKEKQSNFFIRAESSNLGTTYDYGSIMHYGSDAFAINKNIAVITPNNGVPIGQRKKPSETDIIELRLMYQCISGPRTLSEYNSNLCTSDCKCWEGAVGCNGDNAACRGDLKCMNNVCVNGGTTEGSGGCTDVPSNWVDSDGDSCKDYAKSGWCSEYGNKFAKDGKTANQACCACGGGSNSGPVFINYKNMNSANLCIDIKGSSTRDGAAIVHNECNGGSNQKWYWDANNYIRSALDINKCLVGTRGLTDRGTDLIINTCFANDTRFQWSFFPDLSIRPLNNKGQCVGPSPSKQLDGVAVMHIFDCANATNQQWSRYQPPRRKRNLQSATCKDTPLGWYNSFNANCEWYAEDTNCEDYGSGLMNFGKTANQACCACGGGSTANASVQSDFPSVGNPNCWNKIDGWVDSVGDGCDWYSQGDNCIYYGDDFADQFGRTAKEVCCECGGGSLEKPLATNTSSTPGCSDSPSRWVDENNNGCSFYAKDDNCMKFGDSLANYGKTANEVCCVCRTSSTSTKAPTKSPTTETPTPCGLFRLSIFCPFTLCGVFGRLFRLCKN